jgi:hypothetical protein
MPVAWEVLPETLLGPGKESGGGFFPPPLYLNYSPYYPSAVDEAARKA